MKIFVKENLYVLASFIAGFSLMTVELISSRILAPIIGSSIFTWTSVIGITLLGLSIGSWVGGKLADRSNHKNILSLAFLASSALVFIIPILSKYSDFVINSSNSILWLNLLLSSYLFLLPAIAIGAIQPIILKNFTKDFSKLASKYGLLSAVWSIGSVIGVFLTGFVFISTIGSSLTVITIATILFLTGILFINNDKNTVQLFIILLLLAIFSVFYLQSNQIKRFVLFEKETNYYNAKVVEAYTEDFGLAKALFLDIDSHSIEPEKVNEYFYPEMYPVFSYLRPNIKDILVIGAGAYTMPKYFKDYYKNSNVSVIETDNDVKKIAEDYFDLKKYNINTIIGDAKIVIKKDPKKYDLVFGDAYNSFISVPWYLLTKEWNSEVKNKLNESGIYAINFIGATDGPKAEFTKSVLSTFKLSFPNFYMFVFGQTSSQIQNIVLVGINGELPMSEGDLYTKLFKNNSFIQKRMFKSSTLDTSTSTILTDDFSPVEKLMYPIVSDQLPTEINLVKMLWR